MSKKVLVLYGGLSTEREISIRSGRAVASALNRKGYQVIEHDFHGRIEDVVSETAPDLVFIALHGRYGEDGTVQGALEFLKVPYTGSDILASSLCMNKLFTKYMFKALGIPTPGFHSLRMGENVSFNEACKLLNSKRIVVKPNDQGSTIGISIVSDEDAFKKGLKEAFELSNIVLIEEYIKGTEVTVSVIGNYPEVKVLPVIEIIPVHEYYDFASKYTPGMSQHLIPARISDKARRLASDLGKKVYEEFGLRDFARVDMIVRDDYPYVLEINTIPGFTETSLVPDAAKASGMSFEDLVDFIVSQALKRVK